VRRARRSIIRYGQFYWKPPVEALHFGDDAFMVAFADSLAFVPGPGPEGRLAPVDPGDLGTIVTRIPADIELRALGPGGSKSSSAFRAASSSSTIISGVASTLILPLATCCAVSRVPTKSRW
jgi:hypothetical protein